MSFFEAKTAANKSVVAEQSKPTSGTKNGYELRVDLIAMAKDLLEKQYQARASTAANGDQSGLVFPDVDDVLEVAEKMYSFVNSRR